MLSRLPASVPAVTLLCLVFASFSTLPGQTAAEWYALTPGGKSPKAVHDASMVAIGDHVYQIGGYSKQRVHRYDPDKKEWKSLKTALPSIHHFQAVAYGGKAYILGAYDNSFGRERVFEDILVFDPEKDDLKKVGKMPGKRARGSAGAVVHGDYLYLIGGNLDKEEKSLPWLDRYDPAKDSWTKLPDAPHARDHFQARIIGDRIYVAGGEADGRPVAAVDVYDIGRGEWLSAAEAPADLSPARSRAVTAVVNGRLLVIGGTTGSARPSDRVSVLDPATGKWNEGPAMIRGRSSAAGAVLDGRLYVAAGLQRGDAVRVDPEETYLEFYAEGDIGRRPYDDWAVLQDANHVRAEGIMVAYRDEFYWFNGFADDLQQQRYNEKYSPATDTWTPISNIPDGADGNIRYGTHTAVAVIDSVVWFAGNRIGTDPGLVQPTVWIYNLHTDTWSEGPELPMPTGAGGLARVGDEIHYIGGFDEFVSCEVDYHWLYDLKHPEAGWQDLTLVSPMPMARNHFGTAVLGTKIYAVGGQFGHDGCLEGKNVPLLHAYDTETDTWTRLADMPDVNSHFEPGIFTYNDKIYVIGGQDKTSEETWEYDIATDSWTVRKDLRIPLRLIAAGARVYGDDLYVMLGGFKMVGNPRATVRAKSFDPLTSYRLAFHPAEASEDAFSEPGQRIVLANYAAEEPARWSVTNTEVPRWLQLDRKAGTAVQSGTELLVRVDSSGLAGGDYDYTLTASAPGYAPANFRVRFTVTGDSTITEPVDTIAPPTFTGFLEAECAEVGANWTVVDDPDAAGGSYVVVRNGLESKKAAPDDKPENYVRFTYSLPADSLYHVHARMNGPSPKEDSYWLRINGGRWIKWYRDLVTYGAWQWREVDAGPFALPAGELTVDIAFREEGAQLDRLYVTASSELPAGTGPVDPTCAVGSSPALMNSQQNPAQQTPLHGSAEAAFSLYPNPASEALTILLPATETAFPRLSIHDVNGRVVYVAPDGALLPETSLSVDLSSLPAGLYRVSLQTDQTVSSRTFVRVY